MVSRWALVLVAVATLSAACGGDDTEGTVTNLDESAATSTSAGGATTSSVAGSASPAACEVEGGVSTTGTDVIVSLDEWKVAPNVTQVGAGIASFIAENTGEEDHELVIVKADSADTLPRDAAGAMDEAKLPEGALIGEIEPFAAGQLCKGNFALQAGNYVLLCNISEAEADGTKESHFAEGMHAPLIVG